MISRVTCSFMRIGMQGQGIVSVMQSSFAFMVSFTSPASSVAHEDISGMGDAVLDFGFETSTGFIDLCGCIAETSGSIGVSFVTSGSFVTRGVSMVHDARNKAPSRYLMTFSLSSIFR